MTDVRFYHLMTRRLEDVLPDMLLKTIERGQRAVVLCAAPEQAQRLDEHLWTFRPDSFLPHGRLKDGSEADQPVFITATAENPNQANVIFLTADEQMDIGGYALCCDLFDGRDDAAVQAARTKWKAYKAAGHAVQYFQQDENGRWQKAAGQSAGA
jgi:DNA polymerase-3 subunit chi